MTQAYKLNGSAVIFTKHIEPSEEWCQCCGCTIADREILYRDETDCYMCEPCFEKSMNEARQERMQEYQYMCQFL